MAHQVETMAYAGSLPWHGLGKAVLPDLTPEQMLEEAELDWTVEKQDIFFEANGVNKPIPKRKALVRQSDGKLLDIVGSEWNPLQNLEAFEFFNDFVHSGDMEMHTAGSLDGGRRVWALAKVNDAFEVFKDDVVEQYLLLSNPHQYGLSIDVRMTPIRVVCNNTLSFALNIDAERMVKVNHRQEFDAEQVKEMLGVAKEKLDTYKDAAQFLASKRYTVEDLISYYDTVFPVSKKVQEENEEAEEKKHSRNARLALEIIETQPGAEFGKGSWWQAFNSVTYMTDHLMGRSADTRLKSAWFGCNRTKKVAALEKAVVFAEAA